MQMTRAAKPGRAVGLFVIVAAAAVGLAFSPHALDGKHDSEPYNAVRTQAKLQLPKDDGGCDKKRLYCQVDGTTVEICEDGLGLAGVLIMDGAKVITGFTMRVGGRYEQRQLRKNRWFDCPRIE